MFSGVIDANNQFCIISTTDIHGKIWNKNLLTDAFEPNNMLALSSGVKKAKEEFHDRNFVVDNGDLFQGNVLSSIGFENSSEAQVYKENPVITCTNSIGYDAFNLGNHEFNYDREKIIQSYGDSSNIVCGNIYYKDSGKHVYKSYCTKTIETGENEVKIGLICLENTDCSKWDKEVRHPNMIFHSPENPTGDISYEIKKIQKEMIDAGDICDFTMVAYHSGCFPEGTSFGEDEYDKYIEQMKEDAAKPLEFLKNTENQAYRALINSTGIDMFVCGHDHCNSYSNSVFQNADGKDVVLVNGGGKDFTKTIFRTIKGEDGKLSFELVSSKNESLTNYSVDHDLFIKLRPVIISIKEILDKKISAWGGEWSFSDDNKDFWLKQMDVLDLINRSTIYFSNTELKDVYKSTSQINNRIKASGLSFNEPNIKVKLSLSTNGVSVPKYDISSFTNKTLFELFKFDNYNVVCAAKGQEIKDILEYDAVNRYKVDTDSNGEKKLDIIGDKYSLPIFYGLNFTIDMNKPEGQRANITTFSDGEVFDLNKTYAIAIPNYLQGNTSNPTLGILDDSRVIYDQAQHDSGSFVRQCIAKYVVDMYHKYGAVYPTNECEKNGEKPCKWEIIY